MPRLLDAARHHPHVLPGGRVAHPAPGSPRQFVHFCTLFIQFTFIRSLDAFIRSLDVKVGFCTEVYKKKIKKIKKTSSLSYSDGKRKKN